MVFEKSKKSYISCFFLAASLIFIAFVIGGNAVSSLHLDFSFLISGAISIAAAVFIALILSFLSKPFEKKELQKKSISSFAEKILLFFISVFTFISKFIYVAMQDRSLYIFEDEFDIKDFVLLDKNHVFYNNYIADYFFGNICSLLSDSFSRNNIYFGLYVQTFIVLLVTIFLYFILKNTAGRLAGFVGAICFSLSPVSFKCAITYDPSFLFVFSLAVSAFLVTTFCKAKIDGRVKDVPSILMLIFSGLFLGFSSVIDISGILFLIVICILCSKSNNDLVESKSKLYSANFNIFLIIFGYIISFIGFHFLYFYNTAGYLNKNNSLQNYFSDLINYFTDINLSFNLKCPSIDASFILIVAFGFILVFRTFTIKRELTFTFSALSFGLCVINWLYKTDIDYSFIYLFMCSVWAGIGFFSLLPNNLEEYYNELRVKEKAREMKLGYSKTDNGNIHLNHEMIVNADVTPELDFLNKKNVTDTKNKSDDNNNNDNNSVDNNVNKADESASDQDKSDSISEDVTTDENTESTLSDADVSDNVEHLETVNNSDTVTTDSEENGSDILDNPNTSDDNDNAVEEVKNDTSSPDNNENQNITDELNNSNDNNNSDTNQNNITENEAENMDVKTNDDFKGVNDNSVNTNVTIKNMSNEVLLSNTGVNSNPYLGGLNTTQASDEVSPKEQPQPVPIKKFGRRMDYKTAIVSSTNHLDIMEKNIENNTSTSKVKENNDNTELSQNSIDENNSNTENVINDLSVNNNPLLNNENIEDNSNDNTVATSETNTINADNNTASNDESIVLENNENGIKFPDDNKNSENITLNSNPSINVTNNNIDKTDIAASANLKIDIPKINDVVSNGNNTDSKINTKDRDSKDSKDSKDNITKTIPVIVEPIKNPLPVPKKHIPRELNFDIEPAPNMMKFDLVDMKGKDYFDIN